MSIDGRNHHQGSTVNVYRAQQAQGAGGLTRRTWVLTHETLRLALYSITDATARRIFGEEDAIEAAAMCRVSLKIQRGDAVVVRRGQFAGRRFVVTSDRPMRFFAELGLTATDEAIDETIDGVDPDRNPLEAA